MLKFETTLSRHEEDADSKSKIDDESELATDDLLI